MRLGVIADTHGLLRPEVFEVFAGVDHILHAGDIGPLDILTELEAIAPVTAVFGNTDGFDVRAKLHAGGADRARRLRHRGDARRPVRARRAERGIPCRRIRRRTS